MLSGSKRPNVSPQINTAQQPKKQDKTIQLKGNGECGSVHNERWLTPHNVIAMIGLFFLIVYTILTGFMWCANKKAADAAKSSADIARVSLTNVQRAFISFSVHVTPVVVKPVNAVLPTEWGFQIPVANSGTTPTKDFIGAIHSVALLKPMDANYDFHDYEGGTNMFIGAKDGPEMRSEPIKFEDVVTAFERKGHIYIFGWASYNDVFPGTSRHVTKICLELSIGADPRKNLIPPTWYILTPYHNCADDECDAQK